MSGARLPTWAAPALVVTGALVVAAGVALTVWPFDGVAETRHGQRRVGCGTPVVAVGLADVPAFLEALATLPRPPGAAGDPTPEQLERLAVLERDAEEFRACQRPAVKRMYAAAAVELAGIGLALSSTVVRHRNRPTESTRADP